MLCQLRVDSPGRLCCEACDKCVDSDDPPERTRVTCYSPVELQARTFDCLHRGPKLRDQDCKLCGGKTKQVPVYSCAIHGECSLDLWESAGRMRRAGVAYCKLCSDLCDPTDNAGRWWHDEGRVSYSTAPRIEAAGKNVLLKFRHGMGDNLFFTSVLRTLRERRPDLTIDLQCQRHYASLFREFVRDVFILEVPEDRQYDLIYNYPFFECDRVFPDARITKWGKCLWEVHGIQPTIDEARWSVPATTEYDSLAKRFAGNLGLPMVLIHFEGKSSREHKDIPRQVVQGLCDQIAVAGYMPVVLKLDGSEAIRGAVHIQRGHETRPTGDALEIVALARQAKLCVGIDSGPGHLMAASGTPTLQVWLRHHPVHFAQPGAENVAHLVPHDHEANIYGDPAVCRGWLRDHYRLRPYVLLSEALPRIALEICGVQS